MIKQLRDKPLIINSDLDGILSGLLLKKYLNCSIVGFSNSEKEVWLRTGFKQPLNSICFVDLFVANPDLMSIDQHVVSANRRHYELLSKSKNKINPNILNPRFHLPSESYRSKYPFGTVHFLIALLEKEGIDLGELKLFKRIQKIQFIDLILRVDDAMKTSVYSSYSENAEEWWSWLIRFSNQGEITSLFKRHLGELGKNEAQKIKFKVGQFLKNAPYNCNSSDGGVRQLTSNGFIKDNVFNYFELLCQFIETPLFDLGVKYQKYSGITERLSLSKSQLNELIEEKTLKGRRIFSYAFVRSPTREENFSVTFYQNNK